MLLSKDESHVFFSNYFPMLFYAAVYEGLMPQASALSDMIDSSMEVKIKARDALFEDKEILNHFKQDNKHNLTKEHLVFANNVRSGILADFAVLKQTKQFSVLLNGDNGKFYHVHNITESFSAMLSCMPTYITTAIFNFNGKIICDGLITGTNIQLGKNIVQAITNEYNDCKRNKTVQELIK